MFTNFRLKELEHKLKLDYEKKAAHLEIQSDRERSAMESEKKAYKTNVKTDFEEQCLKLKTECEKRITDLKVKHSEQINAYKAKVTEEFYNKLTNEFTSLQKDGDKNFKFMQTMVEKMLEKTPTQSSKNTLEYIETKSK